MSKENNARPSLFDLGRQADSPECDLGGTMGTPGPASEIDPNQFLDRPDYSQIRWIESESHRCALERLRGQGPHTWVAEALGNETFAGNVIFTQRDRRVLARSKGRPLASNGNARPGGLHLPVGVLTQSESLPRRRALLPPLQFAGTRYR
jgi:hypothetical protein